MSKVFIHYGSNEEPGPTIEVEDSLEAIYKELKAGFDNGYLQAWIKSDFIDMVVDDSCFRNNKLWFRPQQR